MLFPSSCDRDFSTQTITARQIHKLIQLILSVSGMEEREEIRRAGARMEGIVSYPLFPFLYPPSIPTAVTTYL